jgi:putative sterol carrier protein
MSYEEIVNLTKTNLKKTVSKNSVKNTAVEFNICGEGEGAFYIEIKDGKVSLEPYEYYDRDAKIIISANELEKIINREKTPDESFSEGTLTVEGNIDKAREILSSFKAPAKKTSTKSTAKKTVKAEKQIVEKTKSKNSKIAKDIIK